MNKCLSSEMPFSLGFSLTLLFLGNNRKRERERVLDVIFFFWRVRFVRVVLCVFFFYKKALRSRGLLCFDCIQPNVSPINF